MSRSFAFCLQALLILFLKYPTLLFGFQACLLVPPFRCSISSFILEATCLRFRQIRISWLVETH